MDKNNKKAKQNADIKIQQGDYVSGDKIIKAGDNSIVIEGNATIQNQQANKRIFNNILPPIPKLLIGREIDIEDVRTRLVRVSDTNNLTGQNIVAIQGWPGVGKTTLAAALAHDRNLWQHFPDGILWTSLGEEPMLMSSLVSWGHALGCDAINSCRDVVQARDLLAGVLRDKRMLLIVDDVWKIEQAQLFMVGGVDCSILITTRQNEIARKLASYGQVYKLGVLSDENSVLLLQRITPETVKDYPDKSLELVQSLEGLPLAIHVAGYLLRAEREAGFGVEELMAQLQTETAILTAEAPPDRADLLHNTIPTVAALLLTSIEKLDKVIQDCYAYLGVFAPKPATFDLEAMKFVWNVEDPKPIVRILEGRGLLDHLKEVNRYQMHALLVMVAKTLLTNE